MDNQGITADQMARIQAQQAQQRSGFGSVLGGGGLFGGLVSQFGGVCSVPSFGRLAAARSRGSNDLFAALQAQGGIAPAHKRARKVRDYSENLTQKEEKILPIDKR